jgi:hypothetical protein
VSQRGSRNAPRPAGGAASPEGRPRPAGGRDRQQVAVAVGVGLAVLVVAGALLIVLRAGGTETATRDTTTTTSQGPVVDPELLAQLEIPDELPPGDYRALCAVLLGQAPPELGPDGFADIMETYRALQFDPILDAAPDGVRPAFEDLRDLRGEVLATYDQAASSADLELADFPRQWLRAIGISVKISEDQCVPLGLGPPPPDEPTPGTPTDPGET